MKRTESDLVRACLSYLAAQGVFCFRINAGMVAMPAADGGRRRVVRLAPAGCPDILGLYQTRAAGMGRMIGVECKLPGRKSTPVQMEFQHRIRECGGAVAEVHSVHELDSWWKSEIDY